MDVKISGDNIPLKKGAFLPHGVSPRKHEVEAALAHVRKLGSPSLDKNI